VSMAPMNLFITGGSGFLGSALLPRLVGGGHRVLALSRRPRAGAAGVEWVAGDLGDPNSYRLALRAFGADTVVHLAWEGLPDRGDRYSRLNARMSEQLFEVVADEGCRALLAVGSCWEYGPVRGPAREDTPAYTGTPFTLAKQQIRATGERLAARRGVQFTWVRPFFAYGPGQRADALVPTLIARARAGNPLVLRTPDAAHDFVFVDDVADALLLLLGLRPGSHIVNVGSGRLTRVREVAVTVADLAGLDSRTAERNGEDPVETHQGFWADRSRLQALTGWAPRVDLHEGIARTMAIIGNQLGTS
jgi:nucleoside-diphosphate-sugar epimerase